MPFSNEKLLRFCTNALEHPEDKIAPYVQYQRRTVGPPTAGAGEYYLGEGCRMVTVYVMYVSASIRSSVLGGKIGIRLIRMVSEWGKRRALKSFMFIVPRALIPNVQVGCCDA